jgi:hypothetical protein
MLALLARGRFGERPQSLADLGLEPLGQLVDNVQRAMNP